MATRTRSAGTTPRQAQLSMRLDSQVVRAVRCTGAVLNDVPLRAALPEPSVRRGITLECVWRLGHALLPDDVLTLGFTTEAVARIEELPGIVHPVVASGGPPRASGRQRLTWATSITRQDAVWSTTVGADA